MGGKVAITVRNNGGPGCDIAALLDGTDEPLTNADGAAGRAHAQRQDRDTATAEIGRVLRNPCNQLNPELLHKDPDMRPLDDAFKASTVRVLIGRLREGT